MLEVLPLEKVHPAEDNVRRDVGDVKELAASIASVGILEPLIVMPANGRGYTIVAGARRYAAAKVAGLAEVPCIVREFSDEQRAEAMLVENLQREDLDPLEEAAGYQRLAELGWSQRKIAERIGRSQSHVSKRVSLLELPPRARAAIDSGGITVGEGLELLKLKEMPKRLGTALENVTKRNWNVEGAVREQLREHQEAEKRGKVLQKLKASGVKVIESSDHWWHGDSRARPLGTYDGVKVPEENHRSETCHAVVVVRTGETIAACTNPRRHAKDGDGVRNALSEKEKVQRRARIEHNRARRAAEAERRVCIERLLARKVSLSDALGLMRSTWLHREYGVKGMDRLIELLDLPEPKRTSGRMTDLTDRPRVRQLEELAAQGPAQIARVAAAVAIVHWEMELGSDWPYQAFQRGGKYFSFLEDHGYQVSEAERLEMAGKAPR
jgi:ParB family chromosome partitioning protein